MSDIINKRATEEGNGMMYTEEVSGGREKPDGTVLKWVISAPSAELGHGSIPFFCGDVTPRECRVSGSWNRCTSRLDGIRLGS
jgi:hypothetical protein